MVSEKPSMIAVEHGVTLPKGYQEAKGLNLVNLHPWHCVSDQEFDYLFAGVNKRYQDRSMIPFARRADSDDVACFVIRDPEQAAGQVIVVHDFASPGYEVVARMQTFWEWFRYAVNEMIEWHEAG
jgi:hypothetical protein